MQPDERITAAIAAARAIVPRFIGGTGEQVLTDLDAVEELGRIVDGLRLAGAAQVEHLSRPALGEQRLSFQHGARDGAELVRDVARIGHAEAKRRVGLGSALAPNQSLIAEPVPGPYAPLTDAVAAGHVGAESARVIVNAVKALRKRVMGSRLDLMLARLTDAAIMNDADHIRELASAYTEVLDPSGARPDDELRRAKRSFTLGDPRSDGMTRAAVTLLPEHRALIAELLQSRRRGVQLVRTVPGSDDDEDTSGGEWREERTEEDPGDPRSRAQQDYDTLIDLLEAGAKAEQADVATEVIHETVVTITAAELQEARGQGWAPGILTGIPIPVIEQRACTGGTRLLVLSTDGEPLHFGRSRRLFSPAQRKSLMIAAGGRCQYPGCRTPAPYLEAHHADWFARDHGDTDVGNGIMLCSYHHHLVHAVHSPIKIVHHDGDLWIVPQWWNGPPEPRHRRQSGPLRDPVLDQLRRDSDPDRNRWARPRAA